MDQEATPLELGTQPCLRSSPESEIKQDPHWGTGAVPQLKPRVSEIPQGWRGAKGGNVLGEGIGIAGKKRKMTRLIGGNQGPSCLQSKEPGAGSWVSTATVQTWDGCRKRYRGQLCGF